MLSLVWRCCDLRVGIMKVKIFFTNFALIFISLLFVGPLGAQMIPETRPRDLINDATTNFKSTGGQTGVSRENIESVVGGIIRGALTAVGSIFLILMIYGGLLWMTARGEEEQVTKARDLIKAAIIGLVVVVAAYGLTVFIIEKVN